nr:glycosyltransferase [Streptomyces oryzae]
MNTTCCGTSSTNSTVEAEWVKATVRAVTSSLTSFGMTIVEAMRCGLPAVATDLPARRARACIPPPCTGVAFRLSTTQQKHPVSDPSRAHVRN